MDAERVVRFELLATALRTAVLPTIPDVAPDGDAKVHFAFIESYFSNYVEGTKFSIEEAEGIVLRNAIVPGRPKDSHDVLGVFNQAVRGTRDSVPPPDAAFVAGLQDRHRVMLEWRPEAHPESSRPRRTTPGPRNSSFRHSCEVRCRRAPSSP